MRIIGNRRAWRQAGLATALALAVVFCAARPASAQQIYITPDRSIVNFGPQPPVQYNFNFPVTPIVVPGNSFVRIGGNFSAGFNAPSLMLPPNYGFIKPFYTTDRARAANFYGSKNYNPAPIVTGPYQVWW
jgi:hypothetical protein